MPASGGKAKMNISGLTTKRLWIGGFFIIAYLAAAITLFFMISERVSALGSRSLATIVWTGARLQTEYFRLRHAVENVPITPSDEAAATIDTRYEIILNRLNVMQRGIIHESYSRRPETLALFNEIRSRLLGIGPYIATMKLGNFGSRPQVEYTMESLERPVAVFSSDIVNLVDANLREYDIGIANQTRFLALLLLGQILTAIMFFVVLTRQLARLRGAQAALIAANANLRRGEGTIRQSEAELAMARQRLLDGIEAIPDGFALYDADDRLVICNSMMKARFSPDDDTIAPGRTFEEILRRRLAAGRLPVRESPAEEWVAERLREHHSGITAREMRMDGDRTYRILERRTIDGGVVTIVSDISELKEREQRLRESQEILRSVLDSVPVVVTMTDASRRLLLLNRAAERRYNLRSIDVIGRDLAEVVPAPDQMSDLARNHSRLVESGQPQIGSVHNITTTDGDETWIVNRVPVLNDAGKVKYVIRTAYEVPQLAHAYHALDESRTRLMDAVNRARLTYWVGSDDGRSSIIGPGAMRTLGFDSDTVNLSDEDYLTCVHEADRDRVRHVYGQRAADTERLAVEYRFVRPDGEVIWIRETGDTLKNKSGFPSMRRVGTLQDVTEQKQIEMALRQSEARLKGFLDHAPMLMYLKDTEGRFLLVNREFERIDRFNGDPVIGQREADLYPPALGDAFDAHDREVILKGGPVSREFSLPDLSESYHDVMTIKFPIRDDTGRTIAVGGFTQDISEHKRAERTLKESEARLRRAQQQARLTYWSFDLTSHSYSWAPGSGALLGVDDSALPVRQSEMTPIIHPDDRERLFAMLDAVEAGRDNYEAEFRLLHRDGGIVWVREQGDVERDSEDRRTNVSGTLQDITPYRQLEEQLVQSQKMEALGQLTGGIAHDFNNLLAVVLGNLDLLADNPGLPQSAKRHIDLAKRAAGRGAEMTRRLLIFARRQPLAPRVTDVNDLIRSMDELLRRPLGRTIDVRLDLAAELWPTEIDQGQMEMTLLNLGVNARDAMPEGGILRIATDNLSIAAGQADLPKSLPPGEYVRIMVSDTGRGMTPDVIARAFDPFFTTKDIGRGTGLGLSMAYGFVTQSGGHIDLSSAPGRGTIVRILLPRSFQTPAGVRPPLSPVGLSEAAPLERVLVVEDDDDVRQVIMEQLNSLGLQSVGAADGVEAMKLLERDGGFSLFVLDIVLPGGVRGTDIARIVQKRDAQAKLLYMSGFVPETGVEQEQLDPAAPCLTKPFTKAALTAAITALLSEEQPRAVQG
jgi:PAS domain S-box-containing protein